MIKSVSIEEAADINPPLPSNYQPATDELVSFVPMSAVGEDGSFCGTETRPFGEVAAGYTQFCEGDVLLAKITPCMENGKAAVVGQVARDVGCGSTEFHVLRPRPGVFSRYLFHSVWNPYFRREAARNMTGSAGQKRVPRSFLQRYKIPLPRSQEQHRIAAILDRADGIRRKRQQALRLADDFLRSVFLDIFGDPTTNPKGWPVLPLSEGVVAFEGGRNLNPTDAARSDGVRVLKVSAVTNGEYRPDESKSFGEDQEVLAEEFVRTGDLLISRANTAQLVGAVAYVWHTEGREMLPDKLWRFVWSDPRRIEPLFMLHMARSSYFRQQLIQRATGTSGSMKNIGKSKMLEIPISLPPIAHQQQFAAIATRARVSAERSLQGFHKSEELFVALQQRAFRGDL